MKQREVAGFYAALLESEHAKDTTFNNNFFEDWKTLWRSIHPFVALFAVQTYIKLYSSETVQRLLPLIFCDFRPMFEHFESEKAKKKAMTTEEKKQLRRPKTN